MIARTVALRLSLIGLIVAVTACGGEDPEAASTTAGPQFPLVAVDAWLGALDTRDYDAVIDVVEPVGSAIVLAVENDLGDDPLAELIESGWTNELAASFWSSFSGEFPLFAGSELSDVVVGRHRDLPAASGSFAIVEVTAGADQGWVLTRRDPNGAWQVDLLGTLGGAFVPLVFDRVARLGDGPAGELIADAIRSTALNSLDAAALAYPDDIRLETEIARIRQLVGSG